MINWIRQLWMRYRSEFLYLVIGGCTTVVNFISYWFFERVCHIYYLLANILAWILAVLFAYVTNRKWVFESKNPNILKEAVVFTASRLFSGGTELLLLFLMVDLGKMNDLVAKAITAVLVVILNYITGKFLVFRKGREG